MRYRLLTREDASRFADAGFRARDFFPHEIVVLPRAGPDAFQTAQLLFPDDTRFDLHELVLYAGAELAGIVPAELFDDSEIVWHEQQFGRPGHVAVANLLVRGRTLFVMQCFSDIVQRISRRRQHKTRVEKVFRGWSAMLANAAMAICLERGCHELFYFSTDLALRAKDPRRLVNRELFDRVYDRTVERQFGAVRAGAWWRIPVEGHALRCVRPRLIETSAPSQTTICICHDIERDCGHRDLPGRLAARSPQDYNLLLLDTLARQPPA